MRVVRLWHGGGWPRYWEYGVCGPASTSSHEVPTACEWAMCDSASSCRRSFVRVNELGVHPDGRHHAAVFVFEDMAVVDEVADVRSAEIHPYRHARERPPACPERHIDHVEKLLLLLRHRF